MKKINQYKLLAGICLLSFLTACDYERINTNPFEMTEEERAQRGIKPLPSTLHNAIKAFKADELIQSALGEHLTQSFIDSKNLEWSKYTQSVSDWERDRYMGY